MDVHLCCARVRLTTSTDRSGVVLECMTALFLR